MRTRAEGKKSRGGGARRCRESPTEKERHAEKGREEKRKGPIRGKGGDGR